MKKYYKFFIILLVISFIVPQIALASWWNPLSWNIWNKIFHKTDTQTQILENRVKELENKLNNQPTPTTTKTDDTKQPATTKQTEPKPENTIKKPTTETAKTTNNTTQAITMKLSGYNSFIDSGIKAFEENITNFNQVITYMNASESHLQEGKTVVSNLLATETESYWIGGWKLIISEGIDKPMAYYESVKTMCQTNINSIRTSIATLQQEKINNLSASPVSPQEYLAYYDKLVKYINVADYAKVVDNTYTEVPSYVDKTNSNLSYMMKTFADKETAWNQANMSSYRNIPSQVNNYYTYTAPPTVQLTQPTKCYIQRFDNGLSTVECY